MIAQYEHMIDTLATHLPAAAEHLEGARDEMLTFTKFPKEVEEDLVEQPERTAQQGDPETHRRRRHLPAESR